MAEEKKELIVNPKGDLVEVKKDWYDKLIQRRLYKKPTPEQVKKFKEQK